MTNRDETSGRDATFCSARAAASAAWRWRICSTRTSCWRAKRVPTGACGAQPAGFNPYAPKPPHFKPRAKAVISLFMSGGVSQVDTFDPSRR